MKPKKIYYLAKFHFNSKENYLIYFFYYIKNVNYIIPDDVKLPLDNKQVLNNTSDYNYYNSKVKIMDDFKS